MSAGSFGGLLSPRTDLVFIFTGPSMWVGFAEYRGASNLAGRSKCVNREAPKYSPREKRIAGGLGVPSRSELGEGRVGIEVLD